MILAYVVSFQNFGKSGEPPHVTMVMMTCYQMTFACTPQILLMLSCRKEARLLGATKCPTGYDTLLDLNDWETHPYALPSRGRLHVARPQRILDMGSGLSTT